MEILKTLGLFIVTAFAEIIGCYLPYLYLKEGKPFWLIFPAVISLVIEEAKEKVLDDKFGDYWKGLMKRDRKIS